MPVCIFQVKIYGCRHRVDLTKHNIDPESINGSDRVLTGGGNGDGQNYPILKSVTIGLNITF